MPSRRCPAPARNGPATPRTPPRLGYSTSPPRCAIVGRSIGPGIMPSECWGVYPVAREFSPFVCELHAILSHCPLGEGGAGFHSLVRGFACTIGVS